MLGAYRLCLALLVALSHCGVSIAGLNPGVFAVVGFYVVSGYVMTGLLRNHYAGVRGIPRFYADRVLRLFPHYLAIGILTFVWFATTRAHTEYLRITPNAADFLNNLLVVPLNFYMFNHSDEFTLIPPAWSLGAEIQFYLVVPFALLAAGVYVRRWLIAASAAVFIVASFGYINSDWYGYRLLPGVLFMFLLGSSLYDLHHASSSRMSGALLCGAIAAIAAIMWMALALAGKLGLPYNRETLLGLIAGVTAVNLLAPRRRRALDDAIGNLSYGVFLSHFLVMWTVFDQHVDEWRDTTVYLVLSMFTALVMFAAVERPVLAFRHALRKRAATGHVASATTVGSSRHSVP
jgi:peptidoglycan/LPS O-acetylase OafA/YrhL